MKRCARLALISSLFIAVGLFFGYWWFYKLAPVRRTMDPAWCASHSQAEYWREVEKGIRHGLWSHDDGLNVGVFGDKSWAEYIMARVKPGTGMGCSGVPCHSASAMREITNQDAGENADGWLAWWRQNRSKSQVEWIADGFRQRGFIVDVPPKPEQIPILLELLGNTETNASAAIPNRMRYNAFRCLRDSGFEPVGFALSNRTLITEQERGLLDYAHWDRQWPAAAGAGLLPFAKRNVDGAGQAVPEMLKPWFQTIAGILVFAPLLLGMVFLHRSLRNKPVKSECSQPAEAAKRAGS